MGFICDILAIHVPYALELMLAITREQISLLVTYQIRDLYFMMNYTNNSLGNTGSPIFSISKLSPYLSPMLDYQPRKNSTHDHQLISFHLQQPINDSIISEPIKIEQVQIQNPQHSQSSQIQSPKRRTSKNHSNLSQQSLQIQAIIDFLVENSGAQQDQLLERGKKIIPDNRLLGQVYVILLKKFKKLKKTKEQITKYCMRKAFKFISDRIKKQKAQTNIKDVDECLNLYFSKSQLGQSFSIPFKKNSSQKTMNNNFLKKMFSSQHFLRDYKLFLTHFKQIMEEDNQKKIKYLTDLIEENIQGKSLKKIEGIKRLPWTRVILNRTQQLSNLLINHAQKSDEKLQS